MHSVNVDSEYVTSDAGNALNDGLAASISVLVVTDASTCIGKIDRTFFIRA